MKLESSGKNPQNCPVETDYFFLAGWLAGCFLPVSSDENKVW